MINRFRGEVGLLGPGIDFLKERTGVPTLGVVPFLDGWRGDEEDSLALDARAAGLAVGGIAYRVDPYRPRIEGLFARIERWARKGQPAIRGGGL